MINKLDSLFEEFKTKVEGLDSQANILNLKSEYLGKKGLVSDVLKSLKDATPEQRKEIGPKANAIKDQMTKAIASKLADVELAEINAKLASKRIDISLTDAVQNQNTSSNGTTSTSTTNQEAKLSLKITPQINKVTRFVKLKINQSINDFEGELDTTGNGQATTTRAAVTEVMVRDKDTVVMGGLLRDRETTSFNKVPLLGDIPVLGWLFKNKKKEMEKINMLFFLTPRILANYQNDVAETVKDGLNRRAAHMKDIYGEDDPFGKTAKGLYQKAKMQQKGPLYDEEDASFYKNQNKQGIDNSQVPVNPSSEAKAKDIPSYESISQMIKSKQSSVKKTKIDIK